MKKTYLIFILIFILNSCQNQKSKSSESLYFNQALPGDSPELFAPGIVNTGMPTRDITFSSDGKEAFFGINIGNFSYSTILHSKLEDKHWTSPEVIYFANDPRYSFLEPCFSPLDDKLFFVSNKENKFTNGKRAQSDIWVSEKQNGKWNMPYKLDTLINSGNPEYFPSVAKNGNLYFTREIPGEGEYIFKSEYVNGKYQMPEKLPETINAGRARFNATIAYDESFIIVPVIGLEESFGSVDYYISFWNSEKGWSKLINMGNKINTATGQQYAASFSPDGKYLFFMSTKTNPESKEKFTFSSLKEMHNSPENGNSNIYWIRADFINDLKQKAIYID